jgi:hypothetical protein
MAENGTENEKEFFAWWWAAAFEWDWSKSPADPESRREWAATLREDRATAFRDFAAHPEALRNALALYRQGYREAKKGLVDAEQKLRPLAEQLRLDYIEWRKLRDAKPEGGVQ